MISKYDKLKYWRKVKSRSCHKCSRCSAWIEPTELYYRETLGLVNPPPKTVLNAMCAGCHAVYVQSGA